jgi:S-layer protein
MSVSNQTKISALYAAVFSRAPDKAGLDFWMTQAAQNPTTVFTTIANGFSQHPVFKQVYDGLSGSAYVNALYTNILGGPGDAAGVQFWTNQLLSQTKAQVLAAFVQSSLETDLTTLNLSAADFAAATIRQQTITNKATVGVQFATSLGNDSNLASGTNPSDLASLQADPAYQASVAVIANVTSNPFTASQAFSNIASAVASGNPIAFLSGSGSSAVTGETFTLTTNIDTFNGTSGNDTFNSINEINDNMFFYYGGFSSPTLSTLDTLNGGLGVDTLNIAHTDFIDTTNLVGVSISSIEVANLTSANYINTNTTTWAGLETLNLKAVGTTIATAAATTDVTATGSNTITVNGGNNVTATTTSGLTIGNTTAAAGAVRATATAAATAGTQAIDGGSSQTVAVVGAALAAGQTGSAVTLGAVKATTGAVNVTVANTSSAAETTVASTGGIIRVDGGSTVTVNQSMESTAAAALTILTGSDTVTLTQGAVDINGKASTTSVTVNQSAARTGSNSATAGISAIVAGDVTVDDVNNTSSTDAGKITTVTLNNAGAATINSGALTTLNLAGTLTTVNAGTLGALTTAANTALAVNLNGAVSTGALTIDTDIKTINITASGTANTLADLINASATAVNLAGASALKITANTLAAGAVITSTNTGGVTLTQALAVGQQFAGSASSGNDVITVGASTVAHNTGAGNDKVTVTAAMGTGGSINAGDGDADVLVMTGTLAATLDDTTVFNGTVSGFERLELTDGATVNLANIDGLNHVTLSTAAQTTVLQGATSGATLVLSAAQTSSTVTLATPSGTADVLNVTLTNNATTNYGTVVATGFETVNFTATETGTFTTNTIDTATVTLTNADAKTITVAGNANLALTHTDTALTSLNASANLRGGVTFTTGALAGAATLVGGAGINSIDAKAAVAAVTITGGALADTLVGSATRGSTLNGGAGNDVLTGGAAADVINGGEGTDTFVFSSANVVEQAGSGTTDGAVINLSANAISAGSVFTNTGGQGVGSFLSGTQTSVASNTATYLFSNESSTNASVIDTLSSIENVTGTDKADYIIGSAGANVIRGGAGNDVLTGGAGADTFVFETTATANGTDTITDFTVGTAGDLIDFAIELGDLRGDGTVAQRGASAATLNTNAGLFISSADIANAAAADTFAEALIGSATGDIIYLLGSTDADAATGITTLYRVDYTAASAATITTMGVFNAFELDNLVAANLTDFAAII